MAKLYFVDVIRVKVDDEEVRFSGTFDSDKAIIIPSVAGAIELKRKLREVVD